jgi:hypothetical protein
MPSLSYAWRLRGHTVIVIHPRWAHPACRVGQQESLEGGLTLDKLPSATTRGDQSATLAPSDMVDAGAAQTQAPPPAQSAATTTEDKGSTAKATPQTAAAGGAPGTGSAGKSNATGPGVSDATTHREHTQAIASARRLRFVFILSFLVVAGLVLAELMYVLVALQVIQFCGKSLTLIESFRYETQLTAASSYLLLLYDGTGDPAATNATVTILSDAVEDMRGYLTEIMDMDESAINRNSAQVASMIEEHRELDYFHMLDVLVTNMTVVVNALIADYDTVGVVPPPTPPGGIDPRALFLDQQQAQVAAVLNHFSEDFTELLASSIANAQTVVIVFTVTISVALIILCVGVYLPLDRRI